MLLASRSTSINRIIAARSWSSGSNALFRSSSPSSSLSSTTIARSLKGKQSHTFSFPSFSSKRVFSTSSSSASSSSTDPLLKYNIAVAFNAKEREESFDTSKNPTGEDNYVVFQDTLTNNAVIGVADGVGGWSEVKNCSSADMSRELCSSVAQIYDKQSSNRKDTQDGKDNISAKGLLNLAFDDLKINKKVKVGGTTICFGLLDSQSQILEVLNLGDSWCGQFRDFKCIQQTKFQTHGFNTPYQLSIIPESLQREAAKQGRKYITDVPNDADVYKFKLEKNDIVVFATDGLTDNVVPEDLEVFLRDQYDSDIEKNKKPQVDLQKLADKLVEGVKSLSLNPNYPSPFSQELSALTGQRYSGGKQDDITVVVLQVD